MPSIPPRKSPGQRRWTPAPWPSLDPIDMPSRSEDRRFSGNVEDSDRIPLDLKENAKIGAGSQDVNARHSFQGVGVFTDGRIAVPVSQVVEPGVDTPHPIGVESPQCDLYGWANDERLHDLA